MPADRIITREQLACMLLPLADPALRWEGYDDEDCGDALRIAVGNGFLAPENRTGPEGQVSGAHAEVHAKGHVSGAHAYDHAPRLMPDGHVTRQEMATVAMQACGVNYRNASSLSLIHILMGQGNIRWQVFMDMDRSGKKSANTITITAISLPCLDMWPSARTAGALGSGARTWRIQRTWKPP